MGGIYRLDRNHEEQVGALQARLDTLLGNAYLELSNVKLTVELNPNKIVTIPILELHNASPDVRLYYTVRRGIITFEKHPEPFRYELSNPRVFPISRDRNAYFHFPDLTWEGWTQEPPFSLDGLIEYEIAFGVDNPPVDGTLQGRVGFAAYVSKDKVSVNWVYKDI